MAEDMIKVSRLRKAGYIFNFNSAGGTKRYEWKGSNGSIIHTQVMSKEAVEWLISNTEAFDKGELKIVEDTEIAKEEVNNIIDVDSYKNNSHTKEEIVEMLKKPITKMKADLEKITVQEEKLFVIDVFKEAKIDSSDKEVYLAKWVGGDRNLIFDKTEVTE